MSQQQSNERWINNPERRVGQAQLLRAQHAGSGEQTIPGVEHNDHRNTSRNELNHAGHQNRS